MVNNLSNDIYAPISLIKSINSNEEDKLLLLMNDDLMCWCKYNSGEDAIDIDVVNHGLWYL